MTAWARGGRVALSVVPRGRSDLAVLRLEPGDAIVSPVDRSRLPGRGPDPRFRFPDVRRSRPAERTAPSGRWNAAALPVMSHPAAGTGRVGGRPAGAPGLAAITADLLDEGSGGRSALDRGCVRAHRRSNLDTEVGPDATALVADDLSRYAGRALGLLSDCVARPRLDAADVARVRELRVTRLAAAARLPSLPSPTACSPGSCTASTPTATCRSGRSRRCGR